MAQARSQPLSLQLAGLGKAIRHRRQELGLTQAETARPQCSPGRLSRIENGTDRASEDLIVHLERRLNVPPGTWLRLHLEAQPERWAAQRQYRKRGVAHVASSWAPLYLLDGSGNGTLLVPKVVTDYQAGQPKPYVILEQTIDYVVQLDATETMQSWTIRAIQDDVRWFDFTRTHPTGRLIDHATIGPVEGGRIAGAIRHGVRHFHFMVQLPTPLATDQQHRLTVAASVRGLAVPPGHLHDAATVEGPSCLRVTFPDRRPESVWWYENLPPEAAPGMRSDRRRIVPDDKGQMEKVFISPHPHLARGIGWQWV